MKATLNGKLQTLNDCYIYANGEIIFMKVLPDITDGKQANYSDENGIGRSAPLKIFSHGETRNIGWTVHFIAESKEDAQENLRLLRVLESLVYPDEGTNDILVKPPPICKLKCGKLLSNDQLCAVLKSYSVKFPTDCIWDETTYLPMKFDVELSFDIVFQTIKLPGASKILSEY